MTRGGAEAPPFPARLIVYQPVRLRMALGLMAAAPLPYRSELPAERPEMGRRNSHQETTDTTGKRSASPASIPVAVAYCEPGALVLTPCERHTM